MQRILITGNMGYVGGPVVRHLRATFPGAYLAGYDSGLYEHCLTTPMAAPETLLDEQRRGDIRDIEPADLRGFDAVVHLAAVSNDPIGNRFEAATEEINHGGSMRLANAAIAAGVGHFVFASSCSAYGFSPHERPRAESDELAPITAYARSKVAIEQFLKAADRRGMVTTCLRFATACGASDRIRLDLVLNDFVACACTSGTITVLSNGKAWRPLISVKDMARAIEWAILRTLKDGGEYLVVNTGSDDWNYRVRDLAHAVSAAIPSSSVSINDKAPGDNRSYRVDFSLYRALAPNHQPTATLETTIAELHAALSTAEIDSNFRQSNFARLKALERHIDAHRMSERIRWLPQVHGVESTAH